MTPLRFRALIEINVINPYVLIGATRAARIRKGWRRPLPVRIRVNGQPKKPWRVNLMPVGDGASICTCTAISERHQALKWETP